MRRAPTLALTALALLLLLLTASPAQAGWFRDIVVEVAPYREGDVLRMRERSEAQIAQGEATQDESLRVALVEGLGTAIDRYGIGRDTVLMRVDRLESGEVTYSERCSLLAGGNQTVRHEVLYGSNGFGGSWEGSSSANLGLSRAQSQMQASPDATFWGGCPLHVLARTTFREGERVPVRTLFADENLAGVADPGLSEPAEALKWHGRDALSIRFDLAEMLVEEPGASGHVTVIVADGLPGLVAGMNEVVKADGSRWSYEHELEGYTPGHGAPIPAFRGATLPERNPEARFVAGDPRAVDDAAWSLAYPFAEAVQALRDDLGSGFASWQRAHPGAMLVSAFYDRYGRNTQLATEGTDGGWWLAFGDKDEVHAWYTSRSPLVDASVPTLPVAVTKRTYNFDMGEQDWGFNVSDGRVVTEVADSASLAVLAAGEGVAPERVETLFFGLWLEGGDLNPYYAVSDVSPNRYEEEGKREGRNVNMGARNAGITNIYAIGKRTETDGLLTATSGQAVSEERGASAFSALATPGIGVGLAGGAVTGLALLALLVKFLLLPLYTRLRRDRLLDNPVRARLYERVRAEPGLHRAELVDFAGIGEGATRHHLRLLVGARLLVETADGGYVRYFAAGEVPPDVARREAVLRAGSARRVYDLLVAEPHLSLREAGARLRMSAPSVHRTKRKLEEAGLLQLAPR